MVSKVKIKIKDLYKIFGPSGESHVEKVKLGVGKNRAFRKT
jgi:ABC-type proline/glycine betaine transport system ATPase subunit